MKEHPSLHSRIAQAIQDNITLDWDTDGYSVQADEAARVIEWICLEQMIDILISFGKFQPEQLSRAIGEKAVELQNQFLKLQPKIL